MAASFVLTIGSPVLPVPGNNDFQSDLSGMGLVNYTAPGATLGLDGPAQVDFWFFGSESGYDDTFTATGDVGSVTRTENTAFTPWAPQYLGSVRFNAAVASLAGKFNFTTSGISLGGQNATVGDDGFGIFLRSAQTNGNFTTLWFGYDDQRNVVASDDNHDDFIIKAVVMGIPEASTWGMMIGGLGLAGMTLRSRRRKGVAALV